MPARSEEEGSLLPQYDSPSNEDDPLPHLGPHIIPAAVTAAERMKN